MKVDRCAISVVVPALNEEHNLNEMLKELKHLLPKYAPSWEVVVVNDGSSDGTGRVAESYAKSDGRFRVINNASPSGFGGATIKGYQIAKGDAVTMLPGDNEVVAEDVLRYLPLLDLVDIVVPFPVNISVRPWSRRFLSKLFTMIVNVAYRTSFTYTNGTIIYRRAVLEKVMFHTNGFFYQTDALVQLSKRGYYYAEVPFTLGVRRFGKSKAVSIHSLMNVMSGALALFYELYFTRRIPVAANGVPPTDSVRSGKC